MADELDQIHNDMKSSGHEKARKTRITQNITGRNTVLGGGKSAGNKRTTIWDKAKVEKRFKSRVATVIFRNKTPYTY